MNMPKDDLLNDPFRVNPEPKGGPSLEELMNASRSDAAPPEDMLSDTFNIMPANARVSAEKIDWLIEDYLTREGIGILYGASMSLKTFLAMHVVFCIGDGRQFMGRNVERGCCLYWAGEGKSGFPIRKQAWEKANGVFRGVFDWHDPYNFGDEGQIDRLIAHCKTKFGTHLRLVVIDTLSKAKLGGSFSEVNPTDMAKLLGGFERIGKELGCFVLLIAHENAKGGMMGTVQQVANVDFVGNLERSGTNLSGTLTIEKVKEGRDGIQVPVTYQLVTFDSGASSLAVEDHGEPERGECAPKTSTNVALSMLYKLRTVTKEHLINTVAEITGTQARSVTKSMNRLKEKKLIKEINRDRYVITAAGVNSVTNERLEDLFE